MEWGSLFSDKAMYKLSEVDSHGHKFAWGLDLPKVGTWRVSATRLGSHQLGFHMTKINQ